MHAQLTDSSASVSCWLTQSPLGNSKEVVAIGTVVGIESWETPRAQTTMYRNDASRAKGEWGIRGVDGGKVSDRLLGGAGWGQWGFMSESWGG
jgi:hypothetical protein